VIGRLDALVEGEGVIRIGWVTEQALFLHLRGTILANLLRRYTLMVKWRLRVRPDVRVYCDARDLSSALLICDVLLPLFEDRAQQLPISLLSSSRFASLAADSIAMVHGAKIRQTRSRSQFSKWLRAETGHSFCVAEGSGEVPIVPMPAQTSAPPAAFVVGDRRRK
jgi:hypothetical protein